VLLELKDGAKRAFEGLGLDIRFHREPLRFLRAIGIRKVLDIGANAGQFAAHIRKVLPEARIYSFEPLAAPFGKLAHAMRGDANFEAFQVAVGSQEGEADFDMHEFSVTSSMLHPSERFARMVPAAVERTTVRVPVVTLDRWAAGRDLATPLLVKMDVQGFEDHVIRGGRKTIGRASAVISEVSFAGLYQGQPLFEDILQLMGSLDFRCGGMLDSFCDKQTGEILESDALFLPRERA
jgi:FkbM family methyltransferase